MEELLVDHIVENNSYFGGIAGFQTTMSLGPSENWTLQPSFMAYYDLGTFFHSDLPDYSFKMYESGVLRAGCTYLSDQSSLL